MEYPDGPLVGCRKIVETSLKQLVRPLPDERMKLQEIIDYAEDENLISRSMALKCHEIRRKGNKGAHVSSVKAVDAKMVLELLDDYLRWCAGYLNIIPAQLSGGASPKDPIFIVQPTEEVDGMIKKARLAAVLDDNKGIERKAQAVKNDAESQADLSQEFLEKVEALLEWKDENIGIENDQSSEAQQRLFEGFEEVAEVLKAQKQTVIARFDEVNSEIQEILSEHDFVKKLLGGDKQATLEQHNVMAFPRGSGSVTNILQIAGGAGTGKTLCLVAKIISEIDEFGQQNIFGEQGKRGLFICFDKALANYVREILSGYEGHIPEIDVVNYDEFVNQLVRRRPKEGYEYLAQYASEAKYPGETIIYGSNDEYIELLKTAQETIGKRYPDRAKEYYLNPSDEDGAVWLADELSWIEARFMTREEAEAKYPTAPRTGRGTKRQPRGMVRQIILEIWNEMNRLLEVHGHYTIDQATKRLLNASSLPAYDAIAIDEVQDFSLISIKLLLRLRREDASKVFISGDENQKIYQRDFTWKELDSNLKGYTITLRKNMRNTPAIRCFSDRLLGVECPYEKANKNVHIERADDARVVELLRRLSDPTRKQTTALITANRKGWQYKLSAAGLSITDSKPGEIIKPGLYLLGAFMGKGLEFDNVVVDYASEIRDDEEEEKRLRYVHFTRARKRLYIRYLNMTPKLLTKYYTDFLR